MVSTCIYHIIFTIYPIVPVAITTGASDVTVLETNDAMFMCVFEANPMPVQYTWQFTDSAGTTTELTDGDKYVIQSSSGDNSFTTTLTIISTVYADRGTYNCSAVNMANDLQFISSDLARLTVYGKLHQHSYMLMHSWPGANLILMTVSIMAQLYNGIMCV